MSETVNYNTKGKGTSDGEIKFGHIHDDGVVSGAMIRSGHDPNHYITLDGNNEKGEPHRKNGTMCISPGSFQIKAGERTPPEQPGIFFLAENGDIVIKSRSGRIRIEAVDIQLISKGYDGKTGSIILDANEKVVINSGQIVSIKSKAATKLESEKTVDIIANSILNIYGGLVEFMDGATSGTAAKGSKTYPVPTIATVIEIRQKILSFIETIS